jgi:hypothetical protein
VKLSDVFRIISLAAAAGAIIAACREHKQESKETDSVWTEADKDITGDARSNAG